MSSVYAKQILESWQYMNKQKKPDLIDVENPMWNKETFKKSRRAQDVLPQIFNVQTSELLLKPRGRPKLEKPKERINIRLSQEVIEYFKSSGDGWQTRIDMALKEFIHR